MSPADDTFISGALDNSVRLWDLRSPQCVGLMQVQGKPVCAFDPEGLVFSVGVQSEQVRIIRGLKSWIIIELSFFQFSDGIFSNFVIWSLGNSNSN